MRLGAKIALVLAGVLLCLLAAVSYWLFAYRGDLPDDGRLAEFAPATRSAVSDPCTGTSIAAEPFAQMSDAFKNALRAADPETTWSTGIARSLLCGNSLRADAYQLSVFRLSAQIQRGFSEDQLLAIYANRAYFGDGAIGISQASEHFFQKEPNALTADEAALLAGLIRGPSMFSPERHPDRAIARRNAVLQIMVTQGTLNADEAEQLEARPLTVVPQSSN